MEATQIETGAIPAQPNDFPHALAVLLELSAYPFRTGAWDTFLYSMKTTGIPFQADMVRAILGGRKTLTSRLRGLDRINQRPDDWQLCPSNGGRGPEYFLFAGQCGFLCVKSPYGGAGDRLIGRENCWIAPARFGDPDLANCTDSNGGRRVVGYSASMDGDAMDCAKDYGLRQTPSIHMPFWASRLHLEITRVWPSRLQDMTEEMAVQEGIETDGHLFRDYSPEGTMRFTQTPLGSYCGLWDRINGSNPSRRWTDNPWVWRIMFKRVFFPAVVVSPFANLKPSSRKAVGGVVKGSGRTDSTSDAYGGKAQEDTAMKARDTLPGTLAAAGDFGRCHNQAWPEAHSGGPPLPPKDHAGRETARDSAY